MMQFAKQTRSSGLDKESSHRTTDLIAGLDRSMRSEVLALQRSAGNGAVARLLSGGAAAEAVIQRQPLGAYERDQLATARKRLAELEAEYRNDKEAIVDALQARGPVFNDALRYLHSMKLDYMTEAIASTDEFFGEVQQLARQAITSRKSLDAFLRKLNGYDKSGGKNKIKSVVADLDGKLRSRQRDELSQITKLDEDYFKHYLAPKKSPLTVYRGNGIGVDANSLDDFEFRDIPAGGTRDVSMFGVVQHTHTNTFKNGMVSTSSSFDVAQFWALETHQYGIVFAIELDDYIHVANLLKRRNFKDRYPGQFEVLAPGAIPASKVVSATLYKKNGQGIQQVKKVTNP